VTKPPTSTAQSAAKRKPRGRPFPKGKSGYPIGRKPGSRNIRTLLLEGMSDDDRASIVQKIIRQAKRGCRASQRLIADRIEPARKARVKFKLLPIANAGDVVAAFDHVAAAVAQGVLTLEEAASASIIIEKTRAAIETVEMESRLAAIEATMRSDPDERKL
jgi:hypothetical protein